MSSVEPSTPLQLNPIYGPSLGPEGPSWPSRSSSKPSFRGARKGYERVSIAHQLPFPVKPSVVLKLPFTRSPLNPASVLTDEEKKQRIVQKLRKTSVKRAIAEEQFETRRVRETRILDIGSQDPDERPSPLSLALAVATAVQQTMVAETELIDVKIEETIEQLEVLRQASEEARSQLLLASRQLDSVRRAILEQGLRETDLEAIELPPSRPQTPPLDDWDAVEIARSSVGDQSVVSTYSS